MTRELTATPRKTPGLTPGPSSGRAHVRTTSTIVKPGEAAAIDFLADVLMGDTTWSLGEVRDLLALHTLAGLGHWHAEGLHDTDTASA